MYLTGSTWRCASSTPLNAPAAGRTPRPRDGARFADAVEHIRWRLWHGQTVRALRLIQRTLLAAVKAKAEQKTAAARSAAKHDEGFSPRKISADLASQGVKLSHVTIRKVIASGASLQHPAGPPGLPALIWLPQKPAYPSGARRSGADNAGLARPKPRPGA